MIPYGEVKIKGNFAKCSCYDCNYNSKDLRKLKKKQARQKSKKDIEEYYGTD